MTTTPPTLPTPPARRSPWPVLVLGLMVLATLGTGIYAAATLERSGTTATPQAAVEGFYRALAEGDCEAARALAAPELAAADLCTQLEQARTEWGTLDGVVSTEVDGGEARVVVARTAGGVTDQRIVTLSRVEGGWLLRSRDACYPPEEPEDQGNRHLGEGEPLPEYSSNPPTSGPHAQDSVASGILEEAPPIPELVHSMEHGMVILWTKDLPEDLQQQVLGHVTDVFNRGYDSLIVTPYREMDYRLAMTAWGHLQGCVGVDGEAIAAFVESFYASGPEGFIACFGSASTLPPCRDQA